MKRVLFYLILTFSYSTTVTGQFWANSLKMIEKGEFIDAEKKISKTLQQTPNDVEENFAMSVLLSKRKYTGFNTEKAFEHLMKAAKLYAGIKDEKLLKQLNKIPISDIEFTAMNDTICRIAAEDVVKLNQLADYQKFLDVFKTCPENYNNKVIEARDILAFKNASDEHKVESYQQFISSYPKAVQYPQAVILRDTLAYRAARITDKIDTYNEFLQKYPEAAQVNLVISRIHELAFADASTKHTALTYKTFYDKYPTSRQATKAFELYEQCQFNENTTPGNWSKYKQFVLNFPENTLIKTAKDSIFAIGQRQESAEILDYCVRNFTDEQRKKALMFYHDFFTMDGEKITLDLFYGKYPDSLLLDVKNNDYQLLTMFDELKTDVPYISEQFTKYDEFIRLAAPREKAYTALMRMIAADLEAMNRRTALDKVTTYTAYFKGKNKRFNNLVMFLKAQE
jgi:hypothetical protein